MSRKHAFAIGRWDPPSAGDLCYDLVPECNASHSFGQSQRVRVWTNASLQSGVYAGEGMGPRVMSSIPI